MKIAPNSLSYETKAVVLNARGEYRAADEAMREAIRIKPENAQLLKKWEEIKRDRNGS